MSQYYTLQESVSTADVNAVEESLDFSLLRPHVATLLKKLRKELTDVQTCTYGRPMRYYDAYRTYTVFYNITILEDLAENCTVDESEAISQLLIEYRATTE